MLYRDYPKGDARRSFVVLSTIDSMTKGEATLHRVAGVIEATRAEVDRAIKALTIQFGVKFDRDGSAYILNDWGVLKKPAVAALLRAPTNDAPTP